MATEENKTDTAPTQTLEASAVNSRKIDSSVELQIGGAEENLLTGLKVCPGVAWGLTLQLSSSDLEIHQFAIDKSAVRGEIQRLRMATA